nr:hypothetical protein [Tanacetum cinerariifolium]
LDDYVFKFKISETRTSVNENESIASKSSEEIREEPETVMIDSSTQAISAASSSINTATNIIDAGSLNINTVDSNHTIMPTLEATGIFNSAFNHRDLGAEADTNNLDFSTVVSPIPTTGVQKDHPKEQIIEDPNLNTQTRRMINFSEETAMVSFINRFSEVKTASTLMETLKPLLKDEDGQEVKKVDDEVRIQALVDGKRVNIKEYSINRTLRLDDAEGTSCLSNAEIFKGLARMGYEKPSDKLTFYKAFFSPPMEVPDSHYLAMP